MKAHWTWRYLLRRIPDYFDQKCASSEPWLNHKVREALDSLVSKTDSMVECGSGRSTPWFAERVDRLLSIEFDRAWYDRVRSDLDARQVKNVDLRFVQYSIAGHQQANEYIEVLTAIEDASVDVCLVDGGPRSYCAMAIIPKLKPGGLLVIDDVHGFFPSHSQTPNAFRNPQDIPALYKGNVKLNWRDVYAIVKPWRCLWLSNGVRDTAIFFKPCC